MGVGWVWVAAIVAVTVIFWVWDFGFLRGLLVLASVLGLAYVIESLAQVPGEEARAEPEPVPAVPKPASRPAARPASSPAERPAPAERPGERRAERPSVPHFSLPLGKESSLLRRDLPELPPGAEHHRFQPNPAALDSVIGLEEAKEALRDAVALMLGRGPEARRLREYGVKPPKGILLYGPPGTGKTTFARAAAQFFGCNFVVVSASAVAGPWAGQTEENVRRVFRFARVGAPCIIFWDEIDAVAKRRGSAVSNASSDLVLNTLLAEMDGFQGSEGVVVIAATNRIEDLDPALLRPGRFDVKLEVCLPDRAARERLFRLFLERKPRAWADADLAALAGATEGMSPAEIEAVANEAARRAAKAGTLVDRLVLEEAVRAVWSRGRSVRLLNPRDVWKEIDSLVGLKPVKAFLREVEASVFADRARREKGLPPLTQGLHMAFLGSPGTGKTTVARLVGELFAALGVLLSGHLVETDRSGLVAGYVGQTALKVQRMVEKALGGILFVDEAYSLARGGEQDFGREALDALVKAMEDHRDRLCVILAGYTGEMEALFRLNPGLESRIAFTCEFPDYSPEELLEIVRREAEKRGFRLDGGVPDALLARFAREDLGALGNGRYARKLVEAAARRAAAAGRMDLLCLEDFR